MKFSNNKQSENKISFNAHSPLIEWFYRLKAKFIIRKIRKQYKIPKTTPITYTVVVNYDFNIGDEK